MPPVSVMKIAGLHVTANPYGLPEGALNQADHCVMRAKDTIEPRRGHRTETSGFGTSSAIGQALAFYGDGRIVQFSDTTEKLAYSTTANGSYTAYSGTYTPPSTLLRMKFAEMNSNLYFNTSVGIKALTSLSGTPAAAGIRKVPDIVPSGASGTYLSGNYNATGNWLPSDSRVAYAITYSIRDVNGNLKESPPSGRIEIVNPADVTSIGGLVRTGLTTVTATVASHGFNVGDVIQITPGETDGGADFAASTNFTITAVTATTIVWTELVPGTNGTGSTAQTIQSGLKKVTFVPHLPTGVTAAAYTLKVYRSLISPSATTPASEELYQVYEAKNASTFTDSTPESSLYSAPLYTNPKTGDGINQSNYPPPFAKDLCVWKERMWYANTKSPHRYFIQLLGVGSPDGIQAGDTITIAGHEYAANTFGIHDWDSQISVNVAETSRNLVDKINTVNGGVRAFYVSGQSDAPGKILIEEDGVGGDAFYVSASRPASWSPIVPTTIPVTEASSSRTGSTVTITTGSAHGFTTGDVVYLVAVAVDAAFPAGLKTITVTGASTFTYAEAGTNPATMGGTYTVHATTQASDNDTAPNKIFYSKLQQPEAVPLLNYVTVGAKNQAILRIVPLRDKLFVFKEDAIYAITGDPAEALRADLIDGTAFLMAPDSAVATNNQIFALTNQGVVTVTEAGVGIISRPIDAYVSYNFFRHTTFGYAALQSTVWGCAYDSERSYLLSMGGVGGYTDVLVYNAGLGTWTLWPSLTYTVGAVNPFTDRLHFCTGSSSPTNKMRVESKALTYGDYAGDSVSLTTTATTASTITVTSTAGLTVGDVVSGPSASSPTMPDDFVITAINSLMLTVTPASVTPGYVGTFTAWTAGPTVAVEFAPWAFGAPGTNKQFREVHLHFQRMNIQRLTASARTEQSATATTSALTPNYVLGTGPESTTAPSIQNQRLLIPLEKQRGTVLRYGVSSKEAFGAWQLCGVTVEVDGVSERSQR